MRLNVSSKKAELPTRARYEAYSERQAKPLFRLKVFALGWIAWLVLWTWMSTTRKRYVGMENFDRLAARGKPHVYALWHQNIVFAFYYARLFHAAIMASRSDDGQIAAELIRRAGCIPARGSSSEGGKEALDRMAELVAQGHVGGMICDGPKGPARVMKMGTLRLAQRTGAPILPYCVGAQRKWVFRSWDRNAVPKPFSKVVVGHGQPMYVSADLTPEEMEVKRLELEKRLNELQEAVDRLAVGV